MVYNTTGTFLSSYQTTNKVISDLVLDDLTQNLQQFSPLFFKNTGMDTEVPMVQVVDLSDKFSGSYKGESIDIPVDGKYEAKDKVEGEPVTNQRSSASTVTLTLNKHKYVSILLEDRAMALQDVRTMQRETRKMSKAIAEAFERDIFALASGFSTTVGSGAGDVMTVDDFGEIERKLYQNGIDITDGNTPCMAFVAPEAYEDIRASRDEYQIAGDKGLEGYYKGRIIETPSGVKVMRSNYLTTSSGAIKGMAITPQAMMIGFGIKPRTQTDYILPELGTIIVADVFYGVAELRDEAGILLDFDEVNA